MRPQLFKWFILFFIVILVSVFAHEVAHGISATVAGFPVSTGFNRVGDYGKRPGDTNFREQIATYNNPWDMGPAVTLLLAITFTVALHRVKRPALVPPVAAVALANSFLRLIPMTISALTFVFTGSPVIEDEIIQGRLWYELTGVSLLQYLPPLISIVVSLICIRYLFRAMQRRLPNLVGTRGFVLASLAALLVAIPVLNYLDRVLRINWG